MGRAATGAPDAFAELFWAAAKGAEGKGPEALARHAVACVEAFERGEVLSPETGLPVTLVGLLRSLGEEENLVYGSPEVVRGESFDERALVFSLGVLIFEALTAHHPFGRSDDVRMARLRRGEMGSGVNYFPAVPGGLREILMKAMGPFPEDRYPSLAPMLANLRHYAGSASGKLKKAGFFEAATTVAVVPTAPDGATLQEAATPVLAGNALSANATVELPDDDIELQDSGRIVEPKSGLELPATAPGVEAEFDVPIASKAPARKRAAAATSAGGLASRKPSPVEGEPVVGSIGALLTREAKPAELERTAEIHSPRFRRHVPRYSPWVYMAVGVAFSAVCFGAILVWLLRGTDGQPAAKKVARAGAVAPTVTPRAPGAKTQPAAKVEVKAAAAEPKVAEPKPAAEPKAEPKVAEPKAEPKAAEPKAAEPKTAEPKTGARRNDHLAKAAVESKLPPAVSSGLVIARVLHEKCKFKGTRPLLLAVYASSRGKVVRAFVKFAGSKKRCIRKALPGVDLGVKLKKSDYLEWRIGRRKGSFWVAPLRKAAIIK